MITPASIADWMLLAGSVGLAAAFTTIAHRWVLVEEPFAPLRATPPLTTARAPLLVSRG